jgi:phosphatidylserine/phosphatidylglycerophosphate/cardiolipin synthase-like enzyme
MGLLRPGETCWRLERAERLTLLVDCQDYFLALAQALRRARRSIHLLGWGFDPRTRLAPELGGDAPADAGAPIGRLLADLAAANPALDIRLLVWRSALPISATQAFFPHRARGWFRGTGVRFELDAEVPFGACHHQKLVVIDDELAFVGGADIGGDRWDTPAHLDADTRRRAPSGRLFPPRHEVTAIVGGPLAAAFGTLFRRRWRAAVGELPDAEGSPAGSLWPTELTADITGAQAGIARTLPLWREAPAAREIADLALEAISAARSLIYLEAQYFTWPLAVEALAQRLAEPDGPEIVLICSLTSPSYFDRLTMDRARSNALWRLKAGDVFGRFHAFAPHTLEGRPIIAHAKVMVIDDRLLRISSANLNNRSHGFDTECELAFEAADAGQRGQVAAFRDRLAGHWIGARADEVAAARERNGGLAAGLRALDAGARLRPLSHRRLGRFGEFVADFHLGDPCNVHDSWRPWRRRERLADEARALREAARSADGGEPRPSEPFTPAA